MPKDSLRHTVAFICLIIIVRTMSEIQIEYHPLEPFLPENSRLLMLGSFPPQRKRWSMDFFYPNMQNDMWRIFGYVFFDDRNFFMDKSGKSFDKNRIEDFLRLKGIALYDTAFAVRRLKDNASDKFLEVVHHTDIKDLLERLPFCRAIVTTGQKATETICSVIGVEEPKVGGFTCFNICGRDMKLYRMPSSSRAYPMALEKKADFYSSMFSEIFI